MKKFLEKFSVIYNAPKIIFTIREKLKFSDIFHFRAPTSIGVFIIPFLLFSGKRGWFKYAGNWDSKSQPISYLIQKFFLKKQNLFPVTINGFWKNQKENLSLSKSLFDRITNF